MDTNKIKITVFLFLMIFLCEFAKAEPIPPFRFHLKNEPVNLDPYMATSGESHYLYGNLYRGLVRYGNDGLIKYDLATNCRYIIDIDIKCTLKDHIQWSDGSEFTTQDIAQHFTKLLSNQNSGPLAGLLKNLREIKVDNKKVFHFMLSQPDREFLDKISHPLMAPYGGENKFSGPYKIIKKEKGKKWFLESNENYQPQKKKRPPVEIVFAADDLSAINLYEKNLIDFLWRIPANEVERLQSSPEFFKVPMSRFDYIGFNIRPGKFFSNLENRKKFISSVNFPDFQKILKASGPAGCVSLSDRLLDPVSYKCQKQDESVKPLQTKEKLIYNYSLLGGEDVLKQALFFQGQWKKNLDVTVSLKGLEQKSLLQELKNNPPDIYRKGIALNRPSCLAGLEYFKSDHPENFTGFKSPEFDQMILPLEKRKQSRHEMEVICAAAVEYLFLKEAIGIPLGKMHFSMMLKPTFKGLSINDLNQLDLTELEYVGK